MSKTSMFRPNVRPLYKIKTDNLLVTDLENVISEIKLHYNVLDDIQYFKQKKAMDSYRRLSKKRKLK